MKDLVKKIFPLTPKPIRIFLYYVYESFFSIESINKERYTPFKKHTDQKNTKVSVLFYHHSLLSFGGTEKFLQIIAKNLDPNSYDVYVMYGSKSQSGRKKYLELNRNLKFIPSDYTKRQSDYPFFLDDMKPLIREVVENELIDVIVTAGSGYGEYPINTVKDTPIIMINIFGSPSTQKNIVKHVSISREVAKKVEVIVPKEKIEVMYIPSEKPSDTLKQKGIELRSKLDLKETDFVFGRIGRPDDNIFDPIGINAFKEVVRVVKNAHYLIQSPPPILVKKVVEENIPNIHFLEPTSDEGNIWAFHYAIDALAHFRKDGESCGLNIIESMIAGKPIISHKSHIWNAHLEYLESTFSRISEKDDYLSYSRHMHEYIELKKNGKLNDMGKRSAEKARMFLIENNIENFEKLIDDARSVIL